MEELAGRGLSLNEPLLWEKGSPGRRAFSIPENDVGCSVLPDEMIGSGPDFPDLSELEVVRHYTRLSQWNFGIDSGMYPLGSCTMKYNPKTNERQAALPGFSKAHPLLPKELSQGALRLIFGLEQYLAELTGMAAVTLQPAAGAHGELTGMLILHAYHQANKRTPSKILIPDTAHGTNPASAALCGFQPVTIHSSDKGVLEPDAVAQLMDADTAGIMITNPNTLGLFEENFRKISEIVHEHGGLVYCDGANMNAIMATVKLGLIGADIVHLNLHKTFSTPHGGGGPGSGPVAVKKRLLKFLPAPRLVEDKEGMLRWNENCPSSIGRVLGSNGHFGILIRAYSYIRSMGPENLAKASLLAILNARYIQEELKDTLHLAYHQPCMHECVFSDKDLHKTGITTLDLAKRLIDYGFHPPTIYFPLVVPGAMMIEPTETEAKEEIDRLIAAFKELVLTAENNPAIFENAPTKSKLSRLNETMAARTPCLRG